MTKISITPVKVRTTSTPFQGAGNNKSPIRSHRGSGRDKNKVPYTKQPQITPNSPFKNR